MLRAIEHVRLLYSDLGKAQPTKAPWHNGRTAISKLRQSQNSAKPEAGPCMMGFGRPTQPGFETRGTMGAQRDVVTGTQKR